MTADWPTTGAVPVFVDRDGGRDIVGYTTFTLRQPGVSRYTMTKKLEGDPLGAFRMVGEAQVFERQTSDGFYLAWLVISGDPKDMPDFWPVQAAASIIVGPTSIAKSFSVRAPCAEVLDVGTASGPPKWIKPQLTRLVDEAPAGNDWLHKIKYDGYRMHAR